MSGFRGSHKMGKRNNMRPAGRRVRHLFRNMRVVVAKYRDYRLFFISCPHDSGNRSYFRSCVAFFLNLISRTTDETNRFFVSRFAR